MTTIVKPGSYQDTGAVAWTAMPDNVFNEDWADIVSNHMDRLVDEARTGTVDLTGDEMLENQVLAACAFFVVSDFLQIINLMNPIKRVDIAKWQRQLTTAIHEDAEKICCLDMDDDEVEADETRPIATDDEITKYRKTARRLTRYLIEEVTTRLGYGGMESALAISCTVFRKVWSMQIASVGAGTDFTETALDELVDIAVPGLIRPPGLSAILH